jgi:dephospho-CoA kinase
MKIGIYGKAGSGKTTISALFKNSGYKIVNCDEMVKEAYISNSVIRDFISKNHGEVICIDPREGFQTLVVDKDRLIKVLISDKLFREQLENLLFKQIFKPLLYKHSDIIMDGILPKFCERFDTVLFASCDEKERVRRLAKRGMSKARIKEIDQLQIKWRSC